MSLVTFYIKTRYNVFSLQNDLSAEFKLLALIVIRDMLMFDYDGYLEDRDIINIEKAINSILGDGCLFGFEVKDIKCCD